MSNLLARLCFEPEFARWRLASVVITSLAYLAVFPLIETMGGSVAGILTMPAVLLAGGFFGARVGAVAGAIAWIPATLVLNYSGYEGLFAIYDAQGLPGMVSLIVLGWLLGKLRDGYVRMRTAEKEAISAKRRHEEALIRADRISALGTLAAGVAHEINNPLTSVLTNLSYIDTYHRGVVEDYPDERLDELFELVDEMREGLDRVAHVVRDFQRFSAGGSDLEHEPADLQDVADSALALLRNEIRHKAKLVLDFRATHNVVADQSRLVQVAVNLIMNAIHAVEETENPEICIATYDDGDEVVFSVVDNGKGIAKNHLMRVFQPFFTTKDIGTGTGLGLFISQEIVSSFRGTITVDSDEGEGSTFEIRLPRGEAPAGRSTASLEESSDGPGRILVIDDEPMVARSLMRLLKGYELTAASGAEEALEILETRTDFDVILCDVMMPDVNGIDFYTRLGSAAPELQRRVIFMTGGAFTQGSRDFLDADGVTVIPKPFELEQLRLVVSNLAETAA